MRLYWAIVVMMVVLVGCESVPVKHETNAIDVQAKGISTLTALPQESLAEKSSLADSTRDAVNPSDNLNSWAILPEPFPTVFFPFDSWKINYKDVGERLNATVAWMDRFPQYELTIEGHADIRGTESYNMVLGAKRAQAVKEYLRNLGIAGERLQTVSFGNFLIVCEVNDETSCHQYNRRAELLLN